MYIRHHRIRYIVYGDPKVTKAVVYYKHIDQRQYGKVTFVRWPDRESKSELQIRHGDIMNIGVQANRPRRSVNK